MASKEVFLKGKCKWAKLHQPDTKFDPDGVWSIQLYPDDASLAIITELKKSTDTIGGILNQLKRDADGTYVTFKRKSQKVIKGNRRAFTPPEIIDADGKPSPNTKIGNGSDVTVKIEVYTYTNPLKVKGSACRLLAVRVDNLVPYEADSYTDEETEQLGGLADQPKPLF